MSLIAAASCLALLAQAAASPETVENAARVQSIWDFIVKGGPMMIPILLASLIALAVIIERSVSLTRRRIIPPDFVPGLQVVLRDRSADRAAALAYCQRSPSPIAAIFATAIRRLNEPIELLERHIEQAGRREVLKLRRYLRVLAVIASIAPLLGLLGTIFGMIRAFQTVASSAEALGRAEMLARGIYEAMITTAAGLLVAIPVLIAYHWLAARIERLVTEMDALVVDFIERNVFAPRNGGLAASTPETRSGDPPRAPGDDATPHVAAAQATTAS